MTKTTNANANANGNATVNASTGKHRAIRAKKPVFHKSLFEIVPDDNWDTKKWGPAPSLGFIRADSEFEAIRKAYDRGMLTVNFTFGPKAVKIKDYKRPEEGAV